ncbi:hypothetical protein RD792_011714 [Penstemon davidsonii]|uniref:GIR1-like zinc ribbon domain-containing protein n=1 Tax=Penstemon davidsonii TaxID=160366 RepID=A0ABR0CUX1_9LAMI|nr:hypothetical protein RD792_011714 [Penstemon davidsonii]
MSQRNGAKLNLSPPPRVNPLTVSPTRSLTVSPTSPASSCVSTEDELSPEATDELVLLGCTGCLMYVMVSSQNQRCPKCKSTDLLDCKAYCDEYFAAKKAKKN